MTLPTAPDGGMSLSGAECQWPEHWPAHTSTRACGERDCRRCAMEQEHEESHEGEPCPWDLSGLDEFMRDAQDREDAAIEREDARRKGDEYA